MKKVNLFEEIKPQIPQIAKITQIIESPKNKEVIYLLLRCFLSPGDIVMMAYAVKALHEQSQN